MAIMIEENRPLASFTNFQVGGPARYFCEVTTVAELEEVLAEARQQDWSIFVLAAGTNLIISDQGFGGLVIKVGIGANDIKINQNSITAGAAVSMAALVDASVEAGLGGLDWAGGLPGTLGGAIRGNAGAFRGEIKDSVVSVTSIDINSGQVTTRDNSACQFGYRDSVFKSVEEVIASVALVLQPGDQAALRKSADDHIQFRRDRHPIEFPNAGSIFKNVPVDNVPERFRSHFQDFVKIDPFPIVPTGKIIQDSGLKGYKIGQAQVSEKHANYIVNLGGATATDIVRLIRHIQSSVQQQFGIELEIEPELVGFEA